MKVEVNSSKPIVQGHEMKPGKVYVSTVDSNLVVIMTGRQGVVENERKALVVKGGERTAAVGSLITVTEISNWIEAEASLSILI